MCGRFPQALNSQQYRRSVTPQLPRGRAPRRTRGSDDFHPSHNVAPNTMVPIVRCLCDSDSQATSDDVDVQAEEQGDVPVPTEDKSSAADPLVIQQTMKWGLIPPHQKTLAGPGEALRTINARSDVLLSGSPLWSRPFSKGQRCVVFVQGFYEWLKIPKGSGVERIPHFIGMTESGLGRVDRRGVERRLMPLAGLWEKTYLQGETKPLYTFTIITTDVGTQLEFLHDRQPLILPDDKAIATWLDPQASIKDVTKLVIVYQGPLEVYKVPKEVGKVGNDAKAFLLPVEDRKDGLMAAFGRASKVDKVDKKHESGSKTSKQEEREGDVNTESNAPVKKEDTPTQEIPSQEDMLAADELIDATKQAEQQQQQQQQHQQDAQSSKPVKRSSSSPSSKSSRFSPEPFNPPLSPNRPNGGYSLDDDPHGGLTKYGNANSNQASLPNHKRVAMGKGALEQQFKKQKVKNEAVEEFERQAGMDKGATAAAAATNTTATQSQSPPQPPRTPSKKTNTASITRSSPPSAKSKHKHPKNDKSAGTDIRSFFVKSP